ncbi:YeiH family protein [Asticcacaulis solisilvae]|uniref:YeiH family protein n=1 Tax=Asticcacaulis solisilvae TaxID=1217274 RepID=UPI003FD74985
MPLLHRLKDYWPGLGLSSAVALAAYGIDLMQRISFGHAYVDAIVLSIVLGSAWSLFRPLKSNCLPGISLSTKALLELAVVCLGAGLSLQALKVLSPWLLVGIAGIVAASIALSYLIGRLLKLSNHRALLVACGNSICGNSAISAVAPVIGAKAGDVSASIAFTALLGIAEVLALPLLGHALNLTPQAYGILSGLTVYAVPQVLAATLPYSAQSVHIGTLVKLVRILMLGPVTAAVAPLFGERHAERGALPAFPWFIAGFAVMVGLRSLGLIAPAAGQVLGGLAHALTLVAMAGLGLSVDLQDLGRRGGRTLAAGALSLMVLAGLSLLLVSLLAR